MKSERFFSATEDGREMCIGLKKRMPDLRQIQGLMGRKSQDKVEESGAICLLKSITKINEVIFGIIFALFSTVDMLQNCWVFFPPQTPLAPPEVQQQYLSSIQHLLGDGMVLVL